MTTETKFVVGKWYKNKSGELIRVVCTDKPGKYPLVGHDADGGVDSYTTEGSFDSVRDHRYDLIPTPIEPKKKGVVWVNVYNSDEAECSWHVSFDSKCLAEDNSGLECVARIRVPWEESQFDE